MNAVAACTSSAAPSAIDSACVYLGLKRSHTCGGMFCALVVFEEGGANGNRRLVMHSSAQLATAPRQKACQPNIWSCARQARYLSRRVCTSSSHSYFCRNRIKSR